MVIEKCYIESFGCFKDKSFDFSKGINIIYGENEKGKSTIAAFIRFVLYGFSKKAERERYFPLDISFASGSIDIDTGEKKITLSRTCKGAKETVKAINPLTGLAIEEFCVKNAGELLTGATRSAFEKTLFTPQKQMEINADEDINSKLRSFVNTGSEEINLDKVRKKLDNIRALYYHVKENGGPLYDLKKERDRLYYELEMSKAIFGDYEICLKEYRKLGSEKRELEIEIEKTSLLFEKQKKYQTYKRLSEIKEKKEQLENISLKLENARKEITFDGREISLDDISKMQKKYELLIAMEKELLQEESLLQELYERKSEFEKTKQKLLEISDDINFVQSENDKIKNKTKKSRMTGFLLCILGVFSVSLCLLNPYFSFVSAVFITLGLVFVLKKNKSQGNKIFEKYKVTSLNSLLEQKAMLSGNLKALDYIENDIENKVSKINDIEEGSEKIREDTKKDLKKFLKDEGYDYSLLISDIKIKVLEFDELKSRKAVLEEGYKLISKDFNISDIDNIKDFESFDENCQKEDTEIVDESVLNKKRDSLASLTEKMLIKKNELDNIYSGKELPSQILEKINDTDIKIKKMEENYKSVRLAIEVLEKAEEEIKNTFAPILNQKASDLISDLSNGKYEKMFIDENYNITLNCNGKDYPGFYLSSGMRDMVFFSVRTAVSNLVFSQNMPMFFDDSFVYIDDERLSKIGEFINILGKSRQILIFTCQKRELNIIKSDKIIML